MLDDFRCYMQGFQRFELMSVDRCKGGNDCGWCSVIYIYMYARVLKVMVDFRCYM